MKSIVQWLARHSFGTVIGLFIVLHGAILLCTGFNRPIYGDEGHFVATITQFAQQCSLETLRTYNEMSTPLPFVLYAFWGKLFGLEISALRLFSLLIGFITLLVFYSVARKLLPNPAMLLFVCFLFLIQPYLIGFTMYVYTDMLAILGLLIACNGVMRQSNWQLFVGLVLALLCRQYALFFVINLLLFYGFDLLVIRSKKTAPLFFGVLVSLLPIAALFLFWHGAAPDNEMRRLYLHETVSFSISSWILYIACITIYLFPALVTQFRSWFNIGWTWAAAVLCSLLYFLAPVRASLAAQNVSIETVGLFHRFVHHLFQRQYLEDDLFYLCFILGLVIVIRLIYDLFRAWKQKQNGIDILLILSVLSFLLVMPFSYLRWEKYFMLLLPFLLILLLMPRAHGEKEQTVTKSL